MNPSPAPTRKPVPRRSASTGLDGPMTLFDRFALFVGCGLVGVMTGGCAWLALILFSNFGIASNASLQTLLASAMWLPIGLGALCAVAGAIWPARTADALGTAWDLVFRIFGDHRL